MIIKEITKSEFKKRFPEKNTNGYCGNNEYYLEDGAILEDCEWDGEEYRSEGKRYKPIYDLNNCTYHETVLFFERSSYDY